MEKTAIFLVRHGRTRANEEGRFAGRTDEPLLEKGRKQAQKAAEALLDKGISAIYTSPVLRTVETASIMANILGCPVLKEPSFSEISIPLWDGKLKTELLEDNSSGYQQWKENPKGFNIPGGETLYQVTQRAVDAIERISRRHQGQNIAVVTHLVVLRCLILFFTERDLSEYRSVKVRNAEPLALIKENEHILISDFHPKCV